MGQLVYTENWPLERGQWSKMKYGERQGVVICCPQCDTPLSVSPDKWTFTFHEDGTFSAVPSLHHATPECGWHVVITRSHY